jgi:hypothetical protein
MVENGVPSRAELLVHVLAPLDGPSAATAHAHIAALWEGCRDRLGFTAEVVGAGVPTDLPRTAEPRPGARLLAARERRDDGVQQAVLRVDHDVLCLSVMLAPRPEPGVLDWAALDRRWREVADHAGGWTHPSLLGATRAYLGHLDGPWRPGPSAASAELAAACVPALPDDDRRPGWRQRGVVAGAGFAVWELGAGPDGRPERRIMVLGPGDRDWELSAWTWARADRATPSLLSYLIQAAKVRYQLRVWAEGDAVRALHRRVDARLDRLRASLGQDVPAGRDELARGLRTDLVDLVTMSSRLVEMRHSVGIAATNMAAILAREGAITTGDDLFGDDRALAEHFDRQLAEDIVFLGAVEKRARALAATAGDGPEGAAPTPADLPLAAAEKTELRDQLAEIFGIGPRASQLIEEIGLVRSRAPHPAGLSAREWWAEVFRELDHGAVPAPYRRLLVAVLRQYGHNPVLNRLAGRPGAP